MKKRLSVVLALMMSLTMLVGCGQSGSDGSEALAAQTTEAIESCKTIGDVLALDGTENTQSASYEDTYVYVFEQDDTIYRVIAAIPEEISGEIQKLDVLDEDYNDKLNELVSPLEIQRYENLSAEIPPQEELDKLVGKTGQDLLEDNWVNSGYNLDTMEFDMDHGKFTYKVTFDGKLENSDDFDAEQEIKPLTIKSVAYEGLGDATSLEENAG